MPTLLFQTAEDRLGDALIKLPALRALKAARPDIRLVWTTSERPSAFARGLAPLVEGVIDELHEQTGIGARWRDALFAACNRTFDAVVASDRRLRPTLALRRLHTGRFIAPLRGFLLSDRRPDGAFGTWPVYRQTQCLLELAVDAALSLPRTLTLPAPYVEMAARLLPPGPTFVGFAPGAGGRDKCWPLACFIEVARAQVARGRRPVFFLGPEERPWRAELAAAVPDALFPEDAPEATSLAGPPLSIALAGRLRAAVANDAGAGHLLAAGGQPLVSLFGHTDPRKFEPPYGTRRVLRARDYGSDHVTGIPLAAVIEALDDVCGG
ncbi:MAG: glycosyltransferase family 9 protein [Gammaproteobacteria bacterium]